MSGLWKRIALRCEECKVDCCDDCRLQVDIQLPCGSDAAVNAVANAIQTRLTFDKLLDVIAPFDSDARVKEKSSNRLTASIASDHAKSKTVVGAAAATMVGSTAGGNAKVERGIGTLKLEFIRAHVLEENLPAETDPATIVSKKDTRLRPGDYYLRVAWSGSAKTLRTCTIQQSKGRPSLESGAMRFVM